MECAAPVALWSALTRERFVLNTDEHGFNIEFPRIRGRIKDEGSRLKDQDRGEQDLSPVATV
jgi:hypothetical protein